MFMVTTAIQAQDSDAERYELRVFRLNNVISQETGPTLSQLFEKAVITSDARTNSLIVRGPADELDEIEKLLEKLDTTTTSPAQQYTLAARRYATLSIPRPESPLQKKYQQLESEIDTLANTCRKLERDAEGSSAKHRQELVEDLHRLVAEAFNIRQAMRREDVNQLRERLEKVAATVNEREESRDQIIEHRVASLLDADRDLRPPSSLRGPGSRLVPQSGYRANNAFPKSLAPAQSGPIGMPGMPRNVPTVPSTSSSTEHLDLLKAAEMCRQAAEHENPAEFERQIAAYRSVERQFRTQVQLTTLELQAAESKLEEITKRFARLKELYETGMTSSSEYEKAQGELKLREIDVQRARITKDFYEQLLDEAESTVDKALTTAKKKGR
jgi:hypothetical protein